ncbi:MAG: pyruvate dehydrogenase complex dihydrolipoamide acetyltransferase [Saprospiraceae bacterium]|nr:pyruvate dehydrogenase complex dihydrolipoamide acetyltransferase [Saprospiraceae bacterium]
MAEVIRMPRLSDTMEEGVIVGWLKKVGDPIEPGDILAEVETDKATMELESYHEGYLLHIGVEEGPVLVNGILAVIGEKGEDYSAALEAASAPESSSNGSETSEQPTGGGSGSDIKFGEETSKKESSVGKSPGEAGRIKVSPLAKKMAKEAGIGLERVMGSGEQGRIVKKDIVAILDEGGHAAPIQHSAIFSSGVTEEFPISQMRKTIAKRLAESKFGAPHFYVTIELEMSNAIDARKRINIEAPPKISFNDFVVKAAAMALRQHPAVNSSWLGDKIRQNGDINVGVAVAVDEGLLVPVVQHADQKSFAQINHEVKELATKARDRKLQLPEMQGNTFTISNLGMFNVDEFTAIINPPDSCILAIGSITEKPVVRNGKIEIGNIMKVTLSCDHRVVDGATGAQFLQTFKRFIEDPVKMLV